MPVQYEGVKEDAPPRGLLHGLGKVACYIPGPLVELGLCSTIWKGWRFSSRMVPSSDGGEGPPHVQLGKVANQLPEDAGVVSAYVKEIGVLKFQELGF